MTQENDRLVPRQKFTGRSGFGPNLVVENVDLEKGEVRARRVPTDPKHPYFTTNLNAFCSQFREHDFKET